VHQETATIERGVRVLTTPSTCFQFVPRTERFSVDATPPGWRWLHLASDGTLTTRVGRATGFAVTLDLSGFKKH
jgi:Icc protein